MTVSVEGSVIAPERTAHCAAPSASSNTCGSRVPIAVSFHPDVSIGVLTETECSTGVFVAAADVFSRAVLPPTATQMKNIVRKAARTVFQVYGTGRGKRAQRSVKTCPGRRSQLD